MADKSPQTLHQIAQAQAILNSPEVQGYVRKGGSWGARLADLGRFLQSKGVVIPEGYTISDNGQIVEDHGVRDGIIKGAITLGGPFAAGMLMPPAAAPTAMTPSSVAATAAPAVSASPEFLGNLPSLLPTTYATATTAAAPSIAGAAVPAIAGPAAAAAKKIPWGPIINGAGGALETYGNNRAAGKRQEDQIAADKALEQQRENYQGEQNMADRALDESKLDPFRGQQAQGQAITMADRRQNRTPYAPVVGSPGYTGGYTPSQDARDAAGQLKLSVMAGETAPSQLDPANYGRTGTLNMAAPPDPTTGRATFGGTPAFSYDTLFNDPTADPNDSSTNLIRRRIRQRIGVRQPSA